MEVLNLNSLKLSHQHSSSLPKLLGFTHLAQTMPSTSQNSFNCSYWLQCLPLGSKKFNAESVSKSTVFKKAPLIL